MAEIQISLQFMENGDGKSVYLGQISLATWTVEDLKQYIEDKVKAIMEDEMKLYFMDEDGDRVLLNDMDSYIEAAKDAQKTGRLLVIAEKVTKTATAEFTAAAPMWFLDGLQQLKLQLKQEIMSEISIKQILPEPVAHSTSASIALPKTVSQPKVGKRDYVADSMINGGGNLISAIDGNIERQPTVGAKPKKMKTDYISRAFQSENQPLYQLGGRTCDQGHVKRKESVLVCVECGRDAGQPYFMCLDGGCLATLCHNCEVQHPPGHAMLRLPKQLDGGRRFAASTAHMILLTMKSSKQLGKKSEKKSKEEKIVQKEEKSLKKACKEMGKRKAECVTMEVITGTDGIAVVTWFIVNTGKKQWDSRVKMMCVACSDAELKPVDWEVSVPLLKPGEDAYVDVKMVTPKRAGEYKTFWILTHRGKRLANLSAIVTVPEVNITKEFSLCNSNVVEEHVSGTQQKKQPEDSSPISDTYDVISPHESLEIVDEDGSLVSGITVCKSAAVEQDYDLIPGNCDSVDIESLDETGDHDSSYVSIGSPVTADEIRDATTDLTEMWQRLSLSLTSLHAPTSDAESCTLVALEMEAEELTKSAGESTKPSAETLIISSQNDVFVEPTGRIVESSEEQLETINAPVSAGTIGQEEALEDGRRLLTEEPVAEVGSSNLAQSDISNQDNTGGLKSISGSRSNSFDSKRHQFSETVSNAISNALLTTTQTLATVGATAKEIHSIATAIVRTNFHAHNGKESWQQPRAWVPKGTQTTWTPEESNTSISGLENPNYGYSSYARQLTQLSEMGFNDLEKNERLLRENGGSVDRVILILLDEQFNIL